MSNMIPFILSSPPPIDDNEEDEEDEFGDFRVADHSFSLNELVKPWEESPSNENEGENEDGIIEVPLPKQSPDEIQNSSDFSDNLPSEALQKSDNNADETNSLKEKIRSVLPSEDNGVSEEITVNCVQNSAIKGAIENDDMRTKESDTVDADDNKSDINNSDINGFGNFESGVASDDFSEFTDFTGGNIQSCTMQTLTNSQVINSKVSDQFQDELDDFDDFESADFSSFNTNTVNEELSVEDTLKLMFQNPTTCSPTESETTKLPDSLHSCLDDSSSVWGYLKELETSHALSYQWSDSTANKTFLSSLNIDCRNILLGGKWNVNVPKFASNLRLNPLEPVKADEINSRIDSTSGGRNVEAVVPAAQFDWTSSGLTNPLDGLGKELEASSEEAVASDVAETGEPADEIKPIKPFVEDIFSSLTGNENLRDMSEESVILTPSNPSEADSSNQTHSREIKAEAYAVVESFPDLSFLSARKLMYAANENLTRWRVQP